VGHRLGLATRTQISVRNTDSEAMAQCELFLTVPNRNVLTYLLTFGCCNIAEVSNMQHRVSSRFISLKSSITVIVTGRFCGHCSLLRFCRDCFSCMK